MRARRSSGFTLLEVLVVLTIIGVLLGAANLALSGGESRRLGAEGERLADFFAAARTDAILESRPISVACDAAGCRRTDSSDPLAISVGAGATLSALEVDGGKSNLVFDATGEMPSFRLTINAGDHAYRVRGEAGGDIHAEPLRA